MNLQQVESFLFKLVVGATFAVVITTSTAAEDPVFVDVAAGWGHACALERNGGVWCWGAAAVNGQEADSEEPALVGGLSDIQAIFAGTLGTCAIDSNGRAKCWGANFQESEKRGEPVFSSEPFEIDGLPPVTQVGIGYVHFCAISIVAEVYCWGENPTGELGNGSETSSARPIKVQGLKNTIAIGAGVNNTCAVDAGGRVNCWGTDHPGRGVGSGFVVNSNVPKAVESVTDARTVSNGRNYVCAMIRGGNIQCWGSSLAMPLLSDKVIRRPIVQVDIGVFKGCFVQKGGTLQCWNYDEKTPRIDERLKKVTKISVGGDENSCALLSDGSVHCLMPDGDYKKITLPAQ